MIDQELLHDLTESYLKSVISEASESLHPDFDSFAAFGELGINSFQVLKIIKKLEGDFGRLPKTLLFENFNINDLANYFAEKHGPTLSTRFSERLPGGVVDTDNRQSRPVAIEKAGLRATQVRPVARDATPILIREKDAYAHPELKDLVQTIYTRYKIEGCVSRGTRIIAPNLFIGSARRGYFNYGRGADIVVLYGYAGPRDYVPELLEEVYRYCTAKGLQLNLLAAEQIPSICGIALSATPFGIMQRIANLQAFTLAGGPMRRLRYQVSKFQKSGACRTEEYRCGSVPETDQRIAGVIDRWCESRTVVNPLVHQFRADVLGGSIGSEHRLFLTYLDDVLQNVILITALCEEENGYLMDLEFYLPDMPLGGLEFAIVEIIECLVREGCDVLSLGGTYGCKLEPSAAADVEIDRILDELRAQNIFNDQGNLQFKNKFRPENKPIFLCRPVGSGSPDNVIDIIMMIADPQKMQTPDEEPRVTEPPVISAPGLDVTLVGQEPGARRSTASESTPAGNERMVLDGDDRSRILSDSNFNPLNVPYEYVDFDLKTDSWAQLHMPAIDMQMRHLHSQVQQPASEEDSVRAVFPFAHFVLTSSGQAAENIFFKAWPARGLVPQNLLFPSTIFHLIDKGFSPKELPHPAIFQLSSPEPFKGNMDWEALQAQVAQDPSAIACVCIDVGNNASGGHPVSIQHLHDVKSCLARHSIPLVIDGTRVVQNALFLIEREKEHAGKSVWTVVREIFSYADAVIASLTKEFCVNRGGIVATNDGRLFQRLQELVDEEGAGIDLIEKKQIALSLQNRKHIETKVLQKTENVRLLGRALSEGGVPVVHPGGGHCVLIDVRQIPEFKDLKDPVPSFLAWLYLATGIRGGAHSVGMQKSTRMNDLVRLAIPVGLKRDEIDSVIHRFLEAFGRKANIPELVVDRRAPQPFGNVYATYRLERCHNLSGRITVATEASAGAAGGPLPPSWEAAPGSASGESATVDGEAVTVDKVPAATRSPRGPVNLRPLRAGGVAIVGMAGRYPKAKNLRELWDNLAGGRDCIEEIPADRRERRLQYGSSAKYRAGFIDDVDRFDSMFFNISPREAEMLDPQERQFLEVAWEAIEDAGYYPEILAQEGEARNIGVFVGAVWAMYQILGVDEQRAGNDVAPNSFLWSIANRVSYWMNLSGPSLTVDTACSSSLTALYLACEAIQAGDCSAAIAGGVNLDLHQAKQDINSSGGALSPDGVCRSFGKGANGYVAGEGVGALLLKRLDQAVRDGDHIYGVIKSAVLNHGGRTSGYIVPNPKAQTNVILSALRKANVDARDIGYVEAHGTGTELGDPIEIAGLNGAFSVDNVENQTCAIGSIKTNIGHLEAAAGIVGVTKVLLQMKHRQLVPSLHSSELNGFIDFEHSPFYVVQKLEDWKAKEVDGVRLPLRAGISSFGAGGANAHVILESYEPVEPVKPEAAHPPEQIFPLSARNEDQLRDTAARLAEFLQQNGVDLTDAAHTLQHGRRSFEHRLAVIAETKAELIEKLTRFIDGKKDEDVAVGQVKLAESVTRLLSRKEKQEFIRLLSQGRDPHKIAALWTEGLLPDWQGFPVHGGGRRTSLPTYPFAGKRHWAGDLSAVRHALQPAAGMHPMVDSNESTFERQLFKKSFHDRDFFIYDHLVSDIPTLPGVAYLELVRKAGEIAAGRPVRRIQNILWVSPIAVQNSIPQEVFIELKPAGEAVQFEVFSEREGKKTLHSQGKLLYTNRQDGQPESVDLDALRARCLQEVDGPGVYPLFKSFGLNLGPSFQVLREVYKSDTEILGVLKLPEFRQGDLQTMVLHPSLVDGSLQAGMAARLGDGGGEMLVPYSIGEVEILHPLPANCFSYVTQATDGKKDSRVLKSNVLILDETGRVLARIRESTGVPLLDVHKKSQSDADGVSSLYYSYEWEKVPLAVEAAAENDPKSILLFDVDETLPDLYQARLRQAGAIPAEIMLVRPGEEFRVLDEQSYEIDPRNKDDFTRLFEALLERNWPIQDICFAWTAGPADFREEDLLRKSLERGVFSFLFLCQAMIKAKLERKVQLLYLYSVTAGEAQPHNEAVSGFVNTLHAEHPSLRCKTLEVRQENDSRERMFDALWTELRAGAQDAVAVRYEGPERYVRKLKSFDLEERGDSSVLREKGVYLITGGAGGLGLIFAEFLARQYKARLILTGRSPLSEEGEARLEELRKAGAEVLYLQADVSRREDVENLLNEIRARFEEINGIIHAAGVVRDSYIRNKTPEEMSAVFAPKVHGTLYLDEAAKDETLDFFVTFSSLAAVTGNPGQSDYGFANYFMDSFAAERERLRATGARSGKSLSVNWSLWADGGMRPDEQTELAFKKTAGMWPLSSGVGLDAFVRGLASARSRFAVVEGLQEKLELAWGVKKKTPPPATPVSSNPAAAAAIPDERDGSLLPWLQNELSQIVMRLLKLDADEMSSDKILMDLGFDSIGLTTFANAVNDKFQLDITPVLFFDYPSIDEIAKYLAEERRTDLLRFHRGGDTAAQAGTPRPAAEQHAKAGGAESGQAATFEIRKGWSPAALDGGTMPSPSDGAFSPELRFVNKPIAIVGMSGVMPQSEDLEEFWENLKGSKDLVTVIPPDRWRWEDYYGDPLREANKSNSKWGAFMKEVDKFDPLFFGISPREAQMMDPQQRIFLEHVWKAVEDSGQKVSDLFGTKTGIFVGVATNDYLAVITQQGVPLDGYSASGNSHAVLANRVSFLLGLRGPSAPLDTACSSSLVALHRALESIHTGSCEMAIVGGVHVMLTPAGHVAFSSAGMLSPEGKCKTFDKSANGYVRGEGCGAIFLKSLAAAEADGNHIYAVIKATAENHGGRVTGMTAPNPSAQAEVLIEAYEKGQVDPTTVGFIECHGTGTSLGDPIEIQALKKAFSELYKRHGKTLAATPHLALSSVKTNIGHLETAAGIAGILKVLLAIKHRQIPANIHLHEVNPYINLDGSPFYIADKLTPWKAAVSEDGTYSPLRAGVSSFGFGGANAHVVLEEYIPPKRQSPTDAGEPQLIVLSAKNADRLRAYVQSLHSYLENAEVELIDLAYTLQIGRDEMPERLALVVSSTDDLKHKLQEMLQNGDMSKGVYRNNVGNKGANSQAADGAAGEALVQALIEQKDLFKLAERWISGARIDWRALYKSGVPRRVSAPTYPFARERHWISGEGAKNVADSHQPAVAEVHIHPLVHRNVSTLREQKFLSRFTGSEFYLADHSTATHAILPAAAHIEMVAAAGELAGEQKVRTIRSMALLTPLTAQGHPIDVEVTLTPAGNEVEFAVTTLADGASTTHSRGKLSYAATGSPPALLDLSAIRTRCSDTVIQGADLYPFLCTSGLRFGKGFQVVQEVIASKSECLAVLRLPEHLEREASQFWLHPALLDGGMHTAIGLVKKNRPAVPWSLPYSVGEVQIFRSLRDVRYVYATWDIDSVRDEHSLIRINLQFVDQEGACLVRVKDLVAKPFLEGAGRANPVEVTRGRDFSQTESSTGLESLIPVWNPVHLDASQRNALSESTRVLLLGSDHAQLDWVRESYPAARLLQIIPTSSVESIAQALADSPFDHLLWVAPDVTPDAASRRGDVRMIEQQEEGVLAVFRIIKALLQLGYANKNLQWTFVTGRTQRVTEAEPIQAAHAAIAGLVGSLAKEYPNWDVRILDLDSLEPVSARECLSLPFDKKGDALAHRHGEWFQQGLALVATLPEATPGYRQNGVYVVIGGAGGVGEVWSRYLIEHYQANVVWIGRRECDANIEAKIHALSGIGPAPLYISADASDPAALERARRAVLDVYPAIHGVVHSAIVLRDQSLSRMDESAFRASLSAKVDVSVNMDEVFGNDELDFLLFFSSIISFVRSPGQSNYAAGCTFMDSFAHWLKQRRAYPVKIMNWGYWGNVGVVAAESYNKMMRQMGIGSIEPQEGMAALEALVGSDLHQLALMKTLDGQVTASLNLSETINYCPTGAPAILSQTQRVLAGQASA
jgi:acyl transferase domain-containing protein/tryptophanase/acyl carrier protein